ncbi:MAG TPA: hypothetical protein VF168_04695 [Trueperaceae bacterium]
MSGRGELEELSLDEAAALLGLSAEGLLALLRDAGLRAVSGAEVRLRAADVLALQHERDRRTERSMEELSRLSEELGEQRDE